MTNTQSTNQRDSLFPTGCLGPLGKCCHMHTLHSTFLMDTNICFRGASRFAEKDDSLTPTVTSLEHLTQKLTDKLAEEVRLSWIDPCNVTKEKYLGHGNSKIFLPVDPWLQSWQLKCVLASWFLSFAGNFSIVWSGALLVGRKRSLCVAIKKRKGECSTPREANNQQPCCVCHCCWGAPVMRVQFNLPWFESKVWTYQTVALHVSM